MNGEVRVEGARELRRQLKAAGRDLDDLKAVNAAVAGLVAGVAAGRAPKRTGVLAGTVRGNRAASKAVVMSGRARVPYAGPIHWGWPARNIKANPFMSEAAVASEPQWVAIYTRGTQDILDSIKGAA